MITLKTIIKDYLKSNLSEIELSNMENVVINSVYQLSLNGQSLYEVWITLTDIDEDINYLLFAKNEEHAEIQAIEKLDKSDRDKILTYGSNKIKTE